MGRKSSIIIRQKIRQARDEAQMTQAELGQKLGHPDGVQVSKWETGKRNINTPSLEQLAKALDKPVAWFFEEDKKTPVPLRRLDTILKEAQAAYELEKHTDTDVLDIIKVPIYDQDASAGPGAPIQSYAYKVPNGTASKNIIGIRVRGECLYPLLQEGDVVFYDTDASPHDKDLVVVIINDTLNVKRFRQRGNETWLESNGDTLEIRDALIQGVVLSFERRLK